MPGARNRPGPRFSLLLAAALGAGGLLLAAPCAPAAMRFQTATATTKVGAGATSSGTVTAHCPTGTRVIGGGYRSTNSLKPNGKGGGLLVHASRRVGSRGWRISAYQAGSTPSPLRLTAVARCGTEFGTLVERSAEVVVSPSSQGIAVRGATASCPAGTFPVSGGFKATLGASGGPDPAPPVIMLGNYAAARSWTVLAARLRSSGSSRVTALAYCGEVRPVVRAKSAIFGAAGRIHRLSSSPCPYGRQAISGGFLAHFPMGPAPGLAIPVVSSFAGERRWQLTGVGISPRSFVSSYAYCL